MKYLASLPLLDSSLVHSIEGGTHEVQLNIIAKRVLGLPSK
ncbi:MAG: hypothetical protein P8H02_05190 [Flavobacteriaceae bacterium]|nr:hypothetical protein [Flavobacteriaceae bacterium]